MKKFTVLLIIVGVMVLPVGCSQKKNTVTAVKATENTLKTETLDIFAMDTYMNIKYFTDKDSDCLSQVQR